MFSRFWMQGAVRGLALGLVFVLAACGSNGDDGAVGAPTIEPLPTIAVSQTIVVTMLDNRFEPAAISVKAGEGVSFKLPNAGVAPHNMHIASARGIYRESPWISTPDPTLAGQTGELVWMAPTEPGVYKFRCDYHEVEMVGVVTVE